jgi:hypothetical protein
MRGRQGGKNEAKKEERRKGIWMTRATVQWVVQWVESAAEQTNLTHDVCKIGIVCSGNTMAS